MTTFNRLDDLIQELYQTTGPDKETAIQMAEDLVYALYNDEPLEMLAILRDYEAAYWTPSGFVSDLVDAIHAHIKANNF